MRTLHVEQPPPIANKTALMLFQRLAANYTADDILLICHDVAAIEECKQRTFTQLSDFPDEAAADLMRLIALQQDQLASLSKKRKERDSQA